MKRSPTISIVIPSLNAVKVLPNALGSIRNQSYPHWEVLLMDGGSTDGTLEAARAYKDTRIRIYSETDRGIYDAMNKGAALANGDWVYFLGADDILHNSLADCIRHFRSNTIIYYGNVYLPHKAKVYRGRFNATLLATQNINHQAIFYPRNVFREYQFDLRYPVLADYDLNIRCWGDRRYRFVHIPIVVATHSDGGISHSLSDDCFLAERANIIHQHLAKQLANEHRVQKLRTGIGVLKNAMRWKKRSSHENGA